MTHELIPVRGLAYANTLNVPVSLDPEQLINSAIGGIGQFYNQTAITTAKIRSIAGASNLLGSSYLVVYRVA